MRLGIQPGKQSLNQAPGAAPEWAGWLALGILVAGFAALAWWLFFSPLPRQVRAAVGSTVAPRVRRLLAVLMLGSGSLGLVGARWDELWHRMYGGFGDDFLWPPHLLLYVSLGMNGGFAVLGLTVALRGRGGVRERFRAEPLLGLLGLLSAYQIASIPSDLLWHEIIGPDITAWSLPHLLLGLTICGVSLTGVPIALSTVAQRSWQSILHQPRPMELVALALVSLGTLNLLQLATTEWEWIRDGLTPDNVVMQRPDWAYPVVVLLLGSAFAHLALFATRRIGAASTVALGVLLVQVVTVAFYRVSVPGPVLVSHVLLVPPALALDAWYGLRAAQIRSPLSYWGGAILYGVVFFALAFPYIAQFMAAPSLDTTGRLEILAVGMPAALVASFVFASLGTWLGQLGRAPTKERAPHIPARGVARV